MNDSKLIKQLQTLDAKALDQFHAFVNSPYFNQHEPTIRLLNFILKYLHSKSDKLVRDKVFAKVFPGEPYDEQVMFNTMSSLKKLYHRFIAQKQFEQEPLAQDNYLLEGTYQRNQFDLLKNRAKQMDKQLQQYPYKDGTFYYANYRYYNTMGYYNTQYEDRSKATMLQQTMDNLDRFYLLEKLRHSCHMSANIKMMNTSFDFSFLEDLLRYYRENESLFIYDYSIQLYYTILMTIRFEDDPAQAPYDHLKSMLDHHVERFNPLERRDLFSFASNYCIRQINKGSREYQQKLFEIYQSALSSGIVLENGLLTEWNYKNITVLGCNLKAFDWTEKFLETYKDKLAAQHRENAYNFNMGYLLYTRKKHNDALDHMNKVKFSDVVYHLNYNFLLVRIYYDMGDNNALLSLIDTFRIYVIRNQKMSTEEKKSYTNFLRFAKKITLVKNEPQLYGLKSKKERFAQLYLQMQSTSNIVNRYWLEAICKEEAENTGAVD